MGSKIKLHRIARLPGMKALYWHGDHLYASRGYELFRIRLNRALGESRDEYDKDRDYGKGWEWDRERVGFYRPDLIRRLASKNRLIYRLLRAGFHSLEVLPDGKIIAILAKAIAVLEPGEVEFKTTWQIKRGTRPLNICVTPDRKVFWGEYFNNENRDEVYIYGSEDEGYSWEVIYSFPRGKIRHIHNIIYDPFEDCLWVLTGDEDHECYIMRVSRDWHSVDTILWGSQQTRAVTFIPMPDALYFATDTHRELNYIYRLKRDGVVERLAPIAGSSTYGCKVGEAIFFSTGVEPSRVNRYPFACLYGSADKLLWEKLIEWLKDVWPMPFFQYGNILLPKGEVATSVLVTTGIAVQQEDNVMHIWRVVSEVN